ncbi:MAG: efflux RND transporter periplasmic adaptor subunit [Chitinophagaceae bacterium]
MNTLLKSLPVLLVIIVASCEQKETVKEAKKQFCLSDTMQKMISVDSVRTCLIEDELRLTGEVSFNENNMVKVFPIGSGQVQEVKVSLGDYVQSGQILAVIKSADIAGNYSDLTAADADVAISKRAMENAASLFKSGLSSEKEYEEAKENYQKAIAIRNKIESVISITGEGNSHPGGLYYIKAKMNGYIVEKKINAGSYIRQDMSDNLFTISDLKDVWIWANVYEADISKVKEGYSATITTLAYPDKIFIGKVDKTSAVLDPVNKVMKVKIRINNDGLLLKPEMFCNVTITHTEPVTSLCIPTSSVVEENGKKYVVVYHSNCNMEVKEIGIVKQVGEKTYISNELKPGEQLITRNQLMIYSELTAAK